MTTGQAKIWARSKAASYTGRPVFRAVIGHRTLIVGIHVRDNALHQDRPEGPEGAQHISPGQSGAERRSRVAPPWVGDPVPKSPLPRSWPTTSNRVVRGRGQGEGAEQCASSGVVAEE